MQCSQLPNPAALASASDLKGSAVPALIISSIRHSTISGSRSWTTLCAGFAFAKYCSPLMFPTNLLIRTHAGRAPRAPRLLHLYMTDQGVSLQRSSLESKGYLDIAQRGLRSFTQFC